MIKVFSENYNGNEIYKYTLKDKIEVEISTLGATLLSLRVPDKNGKLTDVLLGFTNADDMIRRSAFMGAVVGRCGNRIGNGQFELDGKKYNLALNDGGRAHLHGGKIGFNQKNFIAREEGDSLLLSYVSPDGEECYPGALSMTVKYTVKGSTLTIEYFAESDSTTIFNPTNHAYFNLNGEDDGSIVDNILQLNADRYLPVDKCLIPTGEERNVEGTPFDFKNPKAIGKDLDADDEQLKIAGGYDHNFCIKDRHFACVYSLKTGIQMDCYTDRPGVQFYSGNFLNGKIGKSEYPKRSGFCLETQLYPDAINKPNWQSPVLKRDDKFYSITEYSFSLKG